MPTYNYVCESCGLKFSKVQSMNDTALTNCHKCDGRVRRIISGGTGIIFKGSGFYITDYARAKKPAQKQSKVASTDKKVEKLNG